MKTYYALIQKNHIILDVGETKEDSLIETCKNTRTTPETLKYTEYYQSANDGELVLVECTEELYLDVCKYGDVLFEVNNNIAEKYNS